MMLGTIYISNDIYKLESSIKLDLIEKRIEEFFNISKIVVARIYSYVEWIDNNITPKYISNCDYSSQILRLIKENQTILY